jgi:tRNA (guanine10-N2)-dimethyltransferase
VPPHFFLLSGEHIALPSAEVKAILAAENIAHRELPSYPQILRLETSYDAVKAVERRAAMTRTCCAELFTSKPVFSKILKGVRSVTFDRIADSQKSFAVRIRRVRGAAKDLSSLGLERQLGQVILNRFDGVNVSLENPDITFFGVLTEERFLFGVKLGEVQSRFSERRPRKRPFFHPSAMSAKLARCMVNLAQPKSGDLLMDPFCGTGSFLIEAGLLGCRVLGLDTNKRMVRGCLRNLQFFHVASGGVAVADAKNPPTVEVDCVVTDPPYGRSASTMGFPSKQVIRDFLRAFSAGSAADQRICMAAPVEVNLGQISEETGFNHLQSHFVYVHRSLTREIVVMEPLK